MLVSEFINQHIELFYNATDIIIGFDLEFGKNPFWDYYYYHGISDFCKECPVYNWYITGLKFEIEIYDREGKYAVWVKFKD